MRPIRLPPSKFDIAIAEAVEREATPARERPMKVATWLADEHVLCAISGLLWLYSKRGSAAQRAQADHLLLSVVVTTVLPHLVKRVVNQERPDRSIGRRCAGVPKSGNPDDAFPSGHAMHIGAVASAISWMYPKAAVPAWTAGLALACTRILLLAHWTSDVVVGLIAGVLVERSLRPLAFRKPGAGGPDVNRG
jgi:membrane-associated phospholipid phosphatase